MNRTTLAEQLVAALEALPLAGGVHARKYPQRPGNQPPVWPAVRYIATAIPTTDICGSDAGDTDDVLFTIEVTSSSDRGELLHVQLVQQVRAAVLALGPHWVRDSEQDLPDDFSKKVTQTTLDFVVYLSSGMVAAP